MIESEEKKDNKEKTLNIILFIIIIILLLFIFTMPGILKMTKGLFPERWIHGMESNFTCECENECDDKTDVTGSGGVTGTTTIEANNLDIKFDLSSLNIDFNSEKANKDSVKISPDGKKINFNVTLVEPKDYLSFVVDIKNTNSVDIEISELITNSLTSLESKYLRYSITHSNGKAIKVRRESNGVVKNHGEVIKAGESISLRYTIKYRDDFNEPLEYDLVNVPFNCKIVFIQAD